jgi:hypothetical protein
MQKITVILSAAMIAAALMATAYAQSNFTNEVVLTPRPYSELARSGHRICRYISSIDGTLNEDGIVQGSAALTENVNNVLNNLIDDCHISLKV